MERPKLYLDLNLYCRAFNDQTQLRMYREARAVAGQIRTLSSIKGYDAEHLACAELAGCTYLLTGDDRLLRQFNRFELSRFIAELRRMKSGIPETQNWLPFDKSIKRMHNN